MIHHPWNTYFQPYGGLCFQESRVILEAGTIGERETAFKPSLAVKAVFLLFGEERFLGLVRPSFYDVLLLMTEGREFPEKHAIPSTLSPPPASCNHYFFPFLLDMPPRTGDHHQSYFHRTAP